MILEAAAGSFDSLPTEEPYPGVRRSSFDSKHATVTRYSFEPGARFPLHRHPEEQVTLVEDGEVELTVGRASRAMEAGEWSVVGENVVHGLRAGPGGARILAIVMPRRERSDPYTVVEDDGHPA